MVLFKKQKGGGLIRVILLIIILISLLYLGWKIVPAYIQNYELEKAILGVPEQKIINPSYPVEMNQSNVVNYLARMFRVNDMNIPIEAIKLRKTDAGDYEVDVDYEVRQNIAGNLDVIMSFSNHVKV